MNDRFLKRQFKRTVIIFFVLVVVNRPLQIDTIRTLFVYPQRWSYRNPYGEVLVGQICSQSKSRSKHRRLGAKPAYSYINHSQDPSCDFSKIYRTSPPASYATIVKLLIAHPGEAGAGFIGVHWKVFEEFDRICRERHAGGEVLEIGAVDRADTLLRLPALRGARSRVGVNLDGRQSACKDFQILQADANQLTCFSDASFDTVLSNAVHEHDRFFWRSLAEIRRVTRPGGLIVIGVPGFTKLRGEVFLGRVSRLPIIWRLGRGRLAGLMASTLCLGIHLFPSDYYRFSPQAMQEVFLEGLKETEVCTVLVPPRIIGVGVKAS